MRFFEKVDLSQFSGPCCIEDILAYIDSLSDGDAPAKAPATSFTIGIDTPEVVRQKTLECAEKYKVLKIKVGLDNDEEMIRTVRSVTGLPLVVDANQGWKDRSKALDEIFYLAENGVRMVEQPMATDRLDDIAWITERSPIPIFADESIQRLKDIPRIKGHFPVSISNL